MIRVLDEKTIDRIAAGEVVERPSSVVKELLENAVDAGASAVSVDIKNGGIDLIRVTDNGYGISRKEVRKAFLPHATSKLVSLDDLFTLVSFGFRGEALSSIAAVSKVELLTKEKDDPIGVRYVIEGGKEVSFEEAGVPDGTTIIVRDLFYNTPARRKFLKTGSTEAGYISTLVEEMALDRPDISFKYSVNSANRLITTGSGDLKEVIYRIYGRETADSLLKVDFCANDMTLRGYIGKPVIARSSRQLESYFVNERFVSDNTVSKAIEDGYAGFLMQHRFPFTVLKLCIPTDTVDINVHPRKMEIRFSDAPGVYEFIRRAVRDTLSNREFINDFTIGKDEETAPKAAVSPVRAPEPFEIKESKEFPKEEGPVSVFKEDFSYDTGDPDSRASFPSKEERIFPEEVTLPLKKEQGSVEEIKGVQQDFFEEKILEKDAFSEYKIIGQLFNTYWIIEYRDEMLLIDQHAAHEKVNFERYMKEFKERAVITESLNPPIILTLDGAHRDILNRFAPRFLEMGFEIEEIGGNDFAVRQVPYNLLGLDNNEVLTALLDELSEGEKITDVSLIYDKIATMSCKSAVKGGNEMSFAEAEALIKELMTLEDPYTCPHGRPTIIKMSKYELEKKFKRVL